LASVDVAQSSGTSSQETTMKIKSKIKSGGGSFWSG
jgi:hypothetical protein